MKPKKAHVTFNNYQDKIEAIKKEVITIQA